MWARYFSYRRGLHEPATEATVRCAVGAAGRAHSQRE